MEDVRPFVSSFVVTFVSAFWDWDRAGHLSRHKVHDIGAPSFRTSTIKGCWSALLTRCSKWDRRDKPGQNSVIAQICPSFLMQLSHFGSQLPRIFRLCLSRIG